MTQHSTFPSMSSTVPVRISGNLTNRGQSGAKGVGRKFSRWRQSFFQKEKCRVQARSQDFVTGVHGWKNLHPSPTQLGGLGERCKLPQRGLTTILVHCRQKRKHLVLYKNHQCNNFVITRNSNFDVNFTIMQYKIQEHQGICREHN